MQVFYNTFLFSFAEPLDSIAPEGAAKLKNTLPDSSYKFTETRAVECLYFSAFLVENISMGTAMKPNM
jgi:hypothetical protein